MWISLNLVYYKTERVAFFTTWHNFWIHVDRDDCPQSKNTHIVTLVLFWNEEQAHILTKLGLMLCI